jgi:hypothetical protein
MERMTEIFQIDDTLVQLSRGMSFVLFFKAFPQREGLEKQRAVPT